MKIPICKSCDSRFSFCFYLSHFFFLFIRNFRQTCDQISGLDLSAWKTNGDDADDVEPIEDSAETAAAATTVAPLLEELNSDLILAAVERARESLGERRRFEYETWLARKCTLSICPDSSLDDVI